MEKHENRGTIEATEISFIGEETPNAHDLWGK